MRSALILTTTVVLALAIVVRAGAQAPGGRPATAGAPRIPALPPVLQTCPMHPDIIEDKPGTCPLCRMALVPVRLESVWTCPLHAAVVRDAKGRCPVCGRELVQMTMALTWTCKGRPDIDAIEPGRCPDGTAMVAKRTLRPHGNHNPQHGGQFFMAPDNSHHLEGTLPSTRLFRVYVYDDYARPLTAPQLKEVRGRVEIGGQTLPLVVATAGSYLQARVAAPRFPAHMTAKLQLKRDAPEYRFDFAFAGVTKDPNAATAGSGSPTSATANRTGVTTVASAASSDAPPPIDPALIQVPIPSTVPDILSQLRTRDGQVKDLLDRGNLAAVFVPAFQARDLAIALEGRLTVVSPQRRDAAASAIGQLVRAAWLLDSFGDVGNREQATAAYALFHEAAAQIATSFAGVQ